MRLNERLCILELPWTERKLANIQRKRNNVCRSKKSDFFSKVISMEVAFQDLNCTHKSFRGKITIIEKNFAKSAN